jgi:hypothetical protein
MRNTHTHRRTCMSVYDSMDGIMERASCAAERSLLMASYVFTTSVCAAATHAHSGCDVGDQRAAGCGWPTHVRTHAPAPHTHK